MSRKEWIFNRPSIYHIIRAEEEYGHVSIGAVEIIDRLPSSGLVRVKHYRFVCSTFMLLAVDPGEYSIVTLFERPHAATVTKEDTLKKLE